MIDCLSNSIFSLSNYEGCITETVFNSENFSPLTNLSVFSMLVATAGLCLFAAKYARSERTVEQEEVPIEKSPEITKEKIPSSPAKPDQKSTKKISQITLSEDNYTSLLFRTNGKFQIVDCIPNKTTTGEIRNQLSEKTGIPPENIDLIPAFSPTKESKLSFREDRPITEDEISMAFVTETAFYVVDRSLASNRD